LNVYTNVNTAWFRQLEIVFDPRIEICIIRLGRCFEACNRFMMRVSYN